MHLGLKNDSMRCLPWYFHMMYMNIYEYIQKICIGRYICMLCAHTYLSWRLSTWPWMVWTSDNFQVETEKFWGRLAGDDVHSYSLAIYQSLHPLVQVSCAITSSSSLSHINRIELLISKGLFSTLLVSLIPSNRGEW